MLPAASGLGFAVLVATSALAQSSSEFTSAIRPILERSCWNCHGEALQLSGLDLRTRESALRGGDTGAAIVPGRPEESRLYPRGAGAGAGPAAAIAALAGGELSPERLAEAREYWAFQLPVPAPLPDFPEYENPIDRFLEGTRREEGLRAAPRADGRTLVRRAYLDLIGLPPSPEETEAYLADQEPGAWR